MVISINYRRLRIVFVVHTTYGACMIISLMSLVLHVMFPFFLPYAHFIIPEFTYELPFLAYCTAMVLSYKWATLKKPAH